MKRAILLLKTNVFLQKIPGQPGTLRFSGIFDFAVVCLHFSLRGLFSVNFLYFLQKYRCVPKIGFSADISIDVSIDIFIHILIDTFIDVSIDISIDILIDVSIDMFSDISIDISIDILIGILTDREQGGGRKEGRKEWNLLKI